MGSGELTSGVWEINVVWGVQWDLESPMGSEESSGVWGVQWDLESNFNEVLTNW